MKKFIILFLLAIFFCGCSTTYTVRSTVKNNYMIERLKGKPSRKVCSYDYLNEELKGQDATIKLRDGKEIYANEVKIDNDSVSWLDANKYEKSKTSIEQLDKIAIKQFGWSWERIGLGLLGGGGAGLILGISGDEGRLGRGASILFGTIFGVLAGMLVGPIIGLSIGHRYIYEFPLEQPRDSLRNINSP